MLRAHNVAPRIREIRIFLRLCLTLSGIDIRFQGFPVVQGHSRAPVALYDHYIFHQTGGALSPPAPPELNTCQAARTKNAKCAYNLNIGPIHGRQI